MLHKPHTAEVSIRGLVQFPRASHKSERGQLQPVHELHEHDLQRRENGKETLE